MMNLSHSPVNDFLSVIELYGNTVRIRTMADVYCPHGSHIQAFVHVLVPLARRYVHKELAVRYQCYLMQNRFKAFVIQLQPREDVSRRQ